jgi:hypothetical protein
MVIVEYIVNTTRQASFSESIIVINRFLPMKPIDTNINLANGTEPRFPNEVDDLPESGRLSYLKCE